MKRDKKYKILKKSSKVNLPYQISITPTPFDSYDRGKRCLFYIKILDSKITKTEKVAEQVYLDYDIQNRLVGVEII